MKKMMIISECIKVKDSGHLLYNFHFIGVYKGQKIRIIKLLSKYKLNIKIGDEVIMLVECLNVENGILNISMINYNKLNQLNLF